MTWQNYGDASPMIHGGLWARRTDDEIEVVETYPAEEVFHWEEHGELDQAVRPYWVYVDELFEQVREDEYEPTDQFMRHLNQYSNLPVHITPVDEHKIRKEDVDFYVNELMGHIADLAREIRIHEYETHECESEGEYYKILESYGVYP